MSASLEALVEVQAPPTLVAAPRPPVVPLIHSATRMPELDGLRGIAILLVLVFHAAFELHPSSKFLSQLIVVGRLGWSGVDLFFVLSGFLIGGILLDVRSSPAYFRTFYIRRAYRILPLYALALALFSLRFLGGAAGPLGNFSQTAIPWFSYFTFTQNFWMAALGTFGVGAMAATWSLAVEEQFYLTAPIIVRKLSQRNLVAALFAVIVGAALLRTSLYLWLNTGRMADYVLMPCRADALSMGMLSGCLIRNPRWWSFLQSHRTALKRFAWILFAGLVAVTPRGSGFDGPMVTIGYSWLALFYTSLLLIAVTGASRPLQGVLRSRWLVRLGGISYFTYLFHLPAMEAARRILGLRFNYGSDLIQFLGGWLGIGVTLLVATLSWKYFEKPLLRAAHNHKY
jgi:peptidoglycan/LPS O-acetylase OafA/YrhL